MITPRKLVAIIEFKNRGDSREEEADKLTVRKREIASRQGGIET